MRLALADVAPAAQARGIDIGLADPMADACAVNGGAEELRLLVRNLLDNAVKYTPEGGRVDVALHRGDGGVRLRVEDSGPGIPEAERERVLGRFYRSPQSAQQAPGSGLGLAIVQAVAERHGARLTLERSEHLGGLCVQLVFLAISSDLIADSAIRTGAAA